MMDTENDRQWVLVCTAGSAKGREFILLAEEAQVGRTPDNDIHVPDNNVSRQHATVSIKDGQCWVKDLGSKNGIYINEEKVTEAVLTTKDSLRIGGCIFTLQTPESAQPTTGLKDKLQAAQIKLLNMARPVMDTLQGMNRKRLVLYGGGGAALIAIAIISLNSSKPTTEPNYYGAAMTSGTAPDNSNKPARASAPSTIEKKATEDEILSWKSRADVAIQNDDLVAAVPLLRRYLLAKPTDSRAMSQLARAENRLSTLIKEYYESGAREFEKLYFERAIEEWRKAQALSKGFDADTYRQTEEKIQEATSKLLALR